MSRLPIAPAKDMPPAEPVGPRLRRPVPKIGASRNWVLPPRPKPGRKPKSKNKPIKAAASEDPDCGLCVRDECLCQDIGIKSSPAAAPHSPAPSKTTVTPIAPAPQSRPSAAPAVASHVAPAEPLYTEITMSSITKGTVPLKRRPNPSAPKFMRASVENMLSPVALKPTYKLKLTRGEGCGFCTENSPCVCAEAQEKEDNNTEPDSIVGGSGPGPEEIDYGCTTCQQDPMSMLFCLSLSASRPLPGGAVAIPCTMAYRTIVKHPKFAMSDLGEIMMMLESTNKMIGIQSVNRVLQFLNDL